VHYHHHVPELPSIEPLARDVKSDRELTLALRVSIRAKSGICCCSASIAQSITELPIAVA
jgi:hypothetical protein